MNDGIYPRKLIQSFTEKAALKLKKIGEFFNKDRRYKLIEVIEKDINTLCLSRNWSYNLQSNTHILRGNNEKKKDLIVDKSYIHPRVLQAQEIIFLAHV